ncbi:MAG: AAA family ATPase [Eubacteriales bacterium]|nr:AAA family ATPase [Eubacteriales bacterium]
MQQKEGSVGERMSEQRKLPVGIESFEKIRRDGFYYVDKTQLIEKLLDNWGEANLFTRPRRFGKTLNMSMLKSFFEIGGDKSLFDGLYISKKEALCQQYMGKFPVLCVSLKGIEASSYETARDMAVAVVNDEAKRLQFLMESDRLTEIDKSFFLRLVQEEMSDKTLRNSLKELSGLLRKHYGQRVIVLIDEYDVPLAKANEYGYYDQMADLIRSMFGAVLKTNDNLYFGVLTGCLRVARESIFTGMNNFKVYPITNVTFDEYFGFTDAEVRQLLCSYGLEEHYGTIKEWYDGYRFGQMDVYCPWDVICYCADHLEQKQLAPLNYWLNTSGNDVIRHFIDRVGQQQELTRTELERLVNGQTVQKAVKQELTYKELYDSAENIWSALFMTGYLTQRGEPDGDRYNLVIPNREVQDIVTRHILTLFKRTIAGDGKMLEAFCGALASGNAAEVERLFTAYMGKTVSIRDTFTKKAMKENFYHGILLGILGFKDGWDVTSNRESGDGFCDIMIWIDDADTGIIIEVKYAEGDMEHACRRAIEQIDAAGYDRMLRESGVHTVLKYGIACRKKCCRVLLEKQDI